MIVNGNGLKIHGLGKGGKSYMWGYEKKLQYPINIKNKDPQMAKFIISQYGGPDGELGAALRYLSQRFSMPTEITKATLNDIGTEELVPRCYTSFKTLNTNAA